MFLSNAPLAALLLLFAAKVSADETFVFAEPNIWNFTYPSGNWSYVPCTSPKNDLAKGDEECNLFTGHKRSQCIDLEKNHSACVCSFNLGFAPSDVPICDRPGVDPSSCVVGPKGCSRRTVPEAFLIGALNAVNAMLCLVYAFKAVAHLAETGIKFKATITALIFCICALVSHFLWALFYVLQLIFNKGTFQDMILAGIIPAVSIFSVASLLNLTLAWRGVVKNAKAMKANASGNITRGEQMFVLAVTVIFGGVMVMFQMAGFNDILSIVTLVFVLLINVTIIFGGFALAKLLKASNHETTDRMAKTVLNSSRHLIFSLTFYILFAILFSLFSARSFDAGVNMFKIVMAQGLMYCLTFTYRTIVLYALSTGKSRKKKGVAPLPATSTKFRNESSPSAIITSHDSST